MKKVLFASTALVAFAGAAAADVAITGSAEMGIMDTNAVGVDVQFVQDIDVTFTMSGTTDGGLTFGASVDLDENAAGVGADDAGTTAFISGDFGTLTMGDTDGALDWAMSEVNVAGSSINDNETTHAGFNGNGGLDGSWDGQVLRYDYTMGDFAFAISAELKDSNNQGTGVVAPVTLAQRTAADDNYAIGFKYNLDLGGTTVALGLGHQTGTGTTRNAAGALTALRDTKITGISASATMASGLKAAVNYSVSSTTGVANDVKHMGIGLGYTSGAITVGANYGSYDRGTAATDSDGYGLAAVYDLGGGAALKLGYGSGKTGLAAKVNSWSFGLSMSF